MATRVTMPPPDSTTASLLGDSVPPLDPGDLDDRVPVAKTQLLNDRGDRPAEARWLTAAARPGVVELITTSDDPFTIVTAHAGSRTMRTARLDPEAGLALMVRLTQLLGQLHHDGFVHGKLTVDHVIVGPHGPVLCSPDGTATEPDADLHGIARCMRELARQWDEASASTDWRSQWDSLAERLESADDPSNSMVRAHQALRRMTTPAEPSTPTPASTGGGVPRGLAFAAAAVIVAIGGMAFAPSDGPAAATGPRVVVDGSIYAVGSTGDDVVHLADACDPNAPVVVLRPTTGEVWAFSSVHDGAPSAAVAVVPGATGLRGEQRTTADGTCAVAVARGPAGATEIDTAALLETGSDDRAPDG